MPLNLLSRTLDGVHCHVSFVPICKLERGIVNLGHLAFRQEPHSVDKSQIRHKDHLIYWSG